MPNIQYDQNYMSIVQDILNSKEFQKIDNIEHHGLTRMDHSIKVSYYAYKIAKKMHLNYESVARGGLLHDFFLSNEDRTTFERFISTFTHPKKALKHADIIFELNELEKDIIVGHMFPINFHVPKSCEAWIVNIVDKCIGTYELATNYKLKFSYAANLYTIFIINLLLKTI